MDIKAFIPGYRASEPDHRDFIYAKVVDNFTAEILPTRVMPDRIPVEKQIIGDCVGRSARNIKVIQERINHPDKKYDFEADFVYSMCKKLDGNPTTEGTDPKVAMKVLSDYGICKKGLYPTLTSNANRPEPTDNAITDAKTFKVSAYAKIQTLDEIRHALGTQGPIMIGVIVTDSFIKCEKGGFIAIPVSGNFLGGHALAVDGYDDNMTYKYADGTVRKGFLRFVNSWGSDWGDSGYGYLPYDYITYQMEDLPGFRFFKEAWSLVDMVMPNSTPTPVPPQPKPPVPTPIPPAPTPKPKKDIIIDLGDLNGTVTYDKTTNKITIKQN